MLNTSKNRKLVAMIAAAALLVVTGFFTGRASGRSIIRGFILEKSRYVFFFFTPARQYFQMMVLLNSSDELQRIAGYYALADNDFVDIDFLRDRFQAEKSVTAKRVIIWVMGMGKDREKILENLAILYPSCGRDLGGEILRSIKKLDEFYYLEFIRNRKVDPEFLAE